MGGVRGDGEILFGVALVFFPDDGVCLLFEDAAPV